MGQPGIDAVQNGFHRAPVIGLVPVLDQSPGPFFAINVVFVDFAVGGKEREDNECDCGPAEHPMLDDDPLNDELWHRCYST